LIQPAGSYTLPTPLAIRVAAPTVEEVGCCTGPEALVLRTRSRDRADPFHPTRLYPGEVDVDVDPGGVVIHHYHGPDAPITGKLNGVGAVEDGPREGDGQDSFYSTLFYGGCGALTSAKSTSVPAKL
jgi:hypothetical protein